MLLPVATGAGLCELDGICNKAYLLGKGGSLHQFLKKYFLINIHANVTGTARSGSAVFVCASWIASFSLLVKDLAPAKAAQAFCEFGCKCELFDQLILCGCGP